MSHATARHMWTGLILPAAIALAATLAADSAPTCAQLPTTAADVSETAATDVNQRPERKLHLLEQRRLIRRFDFEEFRDKNFEDFPEDWYPIGRPPRSPDPNFMDHDLHRAMIERAGFPHYGIVRFDPPQVRTDENHALLLGINGGGAGAYLAVGAVPAVPSSDYLIQARVRTDDLHAAQARLIGYFVDINGRVIEASRRQSPPLRTRGDWQTVDLKLWGEYPNAAWIGLSIELRQPQPDTTSPLGRHQIVVPQMDGAAWFDDIDIWQIPYVTVATQSRVNIIRSPKRPLLRMNVRDVTGDRLESIVALYDHRGRIVARNYQRVGAGEPPSWQWAPPLERYGWYVLDMQVFDGRGGSEDTNRSPVARSVGAFLWLGADALTGEGDHVRFGLDTEELPDRQMPLLADMVHAAGTGALVLSTWDRQTDTDNLAAREQLVAQVMRQLAGPNYHLTLSFHPMPRALEARTAVLPDDVPAMFERPWSERSAFLAPFLTQYGQQVRRWKIGRVGAFETLLDPDLPSRTQAIRRELAAIIPSPTLVLPWHITDSRRADLPDNTAIMLDVPPFVLPGQIPAYLQPWQQTPAPPLALRLRTRSARELTQEDRIADLLLRMLHAWEAQPEQILISRPWAASSDRQLTLLPDPLLGVFINTAARLSGRQVVGHFSPTRGTRAIILDGPNGPALAVWNEDATGDNAQLSLDLGGHPIAMDEWGNQATLPKADGRHIWPLTQTPIFIEQLDGPLARFRASFRLDDPFVESVQVPHQRVLSFSNPWPVAISGNFVITSPNRWTFTPTRRTFTLRPSETMRVPIEVTFPISEIAGDHELRARFDFSADKPYRVELNAPIQFGMRGVDFKSDLTLEPGKTPGSVDAIVTMRIANAGDKALLAYAFASLSGYPREEKVLPRLAPGQSVVRGFRFQDAGQAIRDNRLRVGLRDAEGPAVLNHVHGGPANADDQP